MLVEIRKLIPNIANLKKGSVDPIDIGKKTYTYQPSNYSSSAQDRVKEIEDGKYVELIETLMNKPIEELKELYNNREIEK